MENLILISNSSVQFSYNNYSLKFFVTSALFYFYYVYSLGIISKLCRSIHFILVISIRLLNTFYKNSNFIGGFIMNSKKLFLLIFSKKIKI